MTASFCKRDLGFLEVDRRVMGGFQRIPTHIAHFLATQKLAAALFGCLLRVAARQWEISSGLWGTFAMKCSVDSDFPGSYGGLARSARVG